MVACFDHCRQREIVCDLLQAASAWLRHRNISTAMAGCACIVACSMSIVTPGTCRKRICKHGCSSARACTGIINRCLRVSRHVRMNMRCPPQDCAHPPPTRTLVLGVLSPALLLRLDVAM